MSSSENSKLKTNQLQTASSQLLIAKQEKALHLASIVVNEPAKLGLLEMNLTVSEVFDKPLIRQAFKGDKYGTVIYGVVNALLNRLLESFAFTQKLTKIQVEILTVSTLDKFQYESLEDIILFFKMARSGDLGVAKKSVDANLLFGEWMPTYLQIKATEREVYLNKKRGEYMDNSQDVYQAIQVRKSKEELQKKKQAQINYVNEVTEFFDRQMLEDLITDWSKKPKFKDLLKLLKQKRRTILWVKKDHPLYVQKKADELTRLTKVERINKEYKNRERKHK